MPRISRILVALTLVWCCRSSIAEQLLPNGGFETGLDGWVFRPGEDSQITIVGYGGERGEVLELHPNGRLLGVETERLVADQHFQSDQAYQVRVHLKHDSLEKGVFAFSMYCFDTQGKSLKQIAFYGLTSKSTAHDWRGVRGTFGPGSQNPLPEGTRSICIRFSFYEATGDCQGTIAVDNVVLDSYTPAKYEGWPRQVTADVGDLQVRFESRSFWTLYRIDYKGTRLGLDRWGSHYGTVINFPSVGFIGSGHTENEDEQVLDLSLSVDGQPVTKPDVMIQCQQLQLQKESRIRDFVLQTDIDVRRNRIVEDVRITAEKPTPVNLIYHFMHPWLPSATEYLAELRDGERVEGEFQGDRGQHIDQAVQWSALYDGPSGKGIVTYVLDVPTDDDWRTRYWDVPDVYRKHYMATFLNRTVPADREFRYRVLTVPFEAEQVHWKKEAARVAKSCPVD
jgi:hypothetical protein